MGNRAVGEPWLLVGGIIVVIPALLDRAERRVDHPVLHLLGEGRLGLGKRDNHITRLVLTPFLHRLDQPLVVAVAIAEVPPGEDAGILRDRVVWKLTDVDWQEVLGVHLTGTFNMTREVVPIMRDQEYGRIVNVTSYTGLHGSVGQANYAAAKAGIIGFTRTTAKELARFGITVNAISPNAETDMVASIPVDRMEELRAEISMGRFSAPSEVAPAVGFLASEEAGYVTGVVLPVDGGLSI